MECSRCHQQTPGILEGNHLWCDQCGVSIRAQCEFVPSFHNKHSAPRQQIYCRAKRFTKYVQTTCSDEPDIMQHIHDILDLYSSFEFTWCVHKVLTKRIYFFAKPVMLQYCCELLKIKSQNMPCLKDKNREIDQMKELKNLRNTPSWQMIYQI